ncbi:hypothetical protein LWC08_02990 [Desulfobaculum bizertense]|uniref:hypothetical protein n=1 Tax=Desulfobaculum bizertense TaxID=376490 RepID=UPI001F3FA3F9|nr:hypothetical protein [Desulfobaculum bizertense]UIJ38550.1 hypothetical protein LWC08_02990 [Desulfobaculum bizertense]
MSAFTPEQEEAIRDAVAAGVRQVLQEQPRLSDEESRELGHLMGMTKDIGGGDYSRGVERMREHHKLLNDFSESRRQVRGLLCRLVFGGLIAFALWALWNGFKIKIAG